jgi:hypothetical protein
MTKQEFQQMLVDLMNQGLRIDMFIEQDTLWFDLNTGMKSHLHITYDEADQIAKFRGRYDKQGVITDLDDLLMEVRGCDYGRGFASAQWFDIFGDTL